MLALKSKLGMIAGVFAVSPGAASASMLTAAPARLELFETIDVAPRVFAHRLAGDFSQTGQSVDAPLVVVERTSVLHIMKQQVTAADYDRCVAETKCMARSAGRLRFKSASRTSELAGCDCLCDLAFRQDQ